MVLQSPSCGRLCGADGGRGRQVEGRVKAAYDVPAAIGTLVELPHCGCGVEVGIAARSADKCGGFGYIDKAVAAYGHDLIGFVLGGLID